MSYTNEEVLSHIEEEDVRFVRLAFRDAFGIQKNIAVFMKESLLPIIGEDNMFREIPWDESTWEIDRQQAWLDKYYEEENNG